MNKAASWRRGRQRLDGGRRFPRPQGAWWVGPAALLTEAWASIRTNPTRTAVNLLGTALGVIVFVMTASIGASLGRQVDTDFEAVLATEMTIRQPTNSSLLFDWTAPERVQAARDIVGVVDAGLVSGSVSLQASNPNSRVPVDLGLRGADVSALAIIDPTYIAGGGFNTFHVETAAPVIILPSAEALRLNVYRAGTLIDVAGTTFTVVGIYADTERRGDVSSSALTPILTATNLAQNIAPEVLLQIEVGAGGFVAPRAKLALAPEDPSAVLASSPPDPRNFRRRIERTVEQLTITMSFIALAMGTLMIMNSATASVYARTPEIGLRSAIGAPARYIFVQLVIETTSLAILAGILGIAIAIALLQFVSVWQQWEAVIELVPIVQALGLSGLSGALAGLGPATRAIRIQPVDALRR